jgi:UDP-2-acetamido-3-amino-2,3-dideoxy-glucuronate N-acetyltransferase
METRYFAHESAIIDEGCRIGKGCKIWHFTHIMTGCVIGENCNLGQNVVVSPDVVLGRNVKVQNNVSIYTGVICEDDVFLGPSMVFTNVINPRSHILRRDQYQTTLVRRGASIGANATIVCGNEIGEFAFIGAGSVVTKDVPAFALIVGNPGRHVGWMSEYGHRLHFDEKGIAICPESHEKYELTQDGRVVKL